MAMVKMSPTPYDGAKGPYLVKSYPEELKILDGLVERARLRLKQLEMTTYDWLEEAAYAEVDRRGLPHDRLFLPYTQVCPPSHQNNAYYCLYHDDDSAPVGDRCCLICQEPYHRK